MRTFCFRHSLYIEEWCLAVVTQIVGRGAGVLIVSSPQSEPLCFFGKRTAVESGATHCVTWENQLKGLERYVHFLLLAEHVAPCSQQS